MKQLAQIIAILFIGLTPAAVRAEDPPKEPYAEVSLGTIGPYDVGLNMTVRDHADVLAAHYFYANHLKDIPLTPSMDGATLVLREPGGGVFRLHTVGKDSRSTKTFDLYRSLRLEGTWTGGGRTLPVKLDRDGYGLFPVDGRLYANVTSEPDAVFEGRVQRFLHGLLIGDRQAAAREVAYPLRVNKSKRTILIRSRRELLACWEEVFPPKLVASLRHAIPHEMFVHDELASLLNGEVWFGPKGLAVVNEP